MALPPITVQLSPFERLEIVRQEIGTREEELRETEHTIREVLWESERLNYLKGLHPFFQQLKASPQAASLAELQARRESLGQALEVMRGALAKLESETRGQVAPPGSHGAPPPRANPPEGAKRSFGSFDNFRDQRKGPNPRP